jgi:hypothetical protein
LKCWQGANDKTKNEMNTPAAKLQITKARNAWGHDGECSCCGRAIKHMFQVGEDSRVYGEKCALNLAGYTPANQKQVKTIKNRIDSLEAILRRPGAHFWHETREMLGLSEAAMIDRFIETGRIA